MSSILTNNSAMVALQTLKTINSDLAKTQSQIATGKDVATAKDNSAIWAISKVMESDVSGFTAISDSLSLGESTVAVASAGVEQIVEVLNDMKTLAVSGTTENVDFAKIEASMLEMQTQIEGIISASQFNGANLLIDDIDGNGASSLGVLASLDRVGSAAPTAVTIDVAALDLVNTMDIASRTVITTATEAATALTEIEGYLTIAIDGAASMGAARARIEDQLTFVNKLTDAMKSGIGTLVDADMEEASAKLQALQVQQQLGIQALSIANQAPQSILSLFR